MSIAKGLTLPNRQWDQYTPAELAALDDLAPETLVWLLYGTPIDRTHAMQLVPFLEDAFLTRDPKDGILYRPYADNIATLDPSAWADECLRRVHAIGIAGQLIPANELNVEGMGEDWPRQVAWLKAFAARWRVIAPTLPLHLPALSPSGNYQQGFAAYHTAGLYPLFDVIDAHKYSDDQAWPGPLYQGSKPICVTEFNRLDPATFFAEHADSARDACWFLLGGTSDQSQCDILKQPTYYRSFKEWQMPSIGPGLQKAANLIGPFIEDEVYDLPGTNAEVSRTATPKGWASWTKATNETTVYCVDGRIYADAGDHGDGTLKVIRGPFLA